MAAQHECVPRRRRFSDTSIFKEADEGTDARVSFPFHESIAPLFTGETGLPLFNGNYGPYRFLKTQEEIDAARSWEERRRNYIFLRDCLDCSIALDFNLISPGNYTAIGLAEHRAKVDRDVGSIATLQKALLAACRDLSLYDEADYVCAVPPAPDKAFDLPTEIARYVGAHHKRLVFFDGLRFASKQVSVKDLTLSDKWDALDGCGLSVKGTIQGSKIVLLDDKYQSGTTAQYVASKLLEHGAKAVYGLYAVKTWRDSDNL